MERRFEEGKLRGVTIRNQNLLYFNFWCFSRWFLYTEMGISFHPVHVNELLSWSFSKETSHVLLDPWLAVGSNVGTEFHVLSSSDILACFSARTMLLWLVWIHGVSDIKWYDIFWFDIQNFCSFRELIGFQICLSFLWSAVQTFKETLESSIHKRHNKERSWLQIRRQQAFGWHGLGFCLFASATCAVKTDRFEIHTHLDTTK